MSELSFKVEAFEGPLDLLLHLISKNKLDICDIPIATITDQYFEYITEMKNLDMDLGGEFLVMASQLLLIKSRMLLPVEEEDEEDPRAELVDRLIEYKRYKEIAGEMDVYQHSMDNVVFKTPEKLDIPKVQTENRLIPIQKLIDAFFMVVDRSELKKPIDPKNFRRIIGRTNYSVRYASTAIMQRFDKESTVLFEHLFDNLSHRGEYIATFLAILELVKESIMLVEEKEGKIYCERGEKNVELDIREEY